MSDEKIFAPSAEDIAAAKAKHGTVFKVFADPNDDGSDAVIIRRCTRMEYQAYLECMGNPNRRTLANEQLCADAVVWPVPRSEEYNALLAKMPAFVTSIADKITDVSGHVGGGKAIRL